MRYPNGEEIKIGDIVEVGNSAQGVVVCDIGSGMFSSAYPENEWAYLKTGIIVQFKDMGLIHMDAAEDDLRLIARG